MTSDARERRFAAAAPTAGLASSGIGKHAVHEDIAAILLGTAFVAFGTKMFADAGLVAGGVVGVALLVQHAVGFPFWAGFLVVNLPFFLLAWLRLGRAVALRTFVAVLLVAAMSRMIDTWIGFSHLDPFFAVIAGGGICGAGLLMLFRHGTGLGGFNLLAMYLQDFFGLRAGYVQMVLDLLVIAAAVLVLAPGGVLLSAAGAVVLNLVLAMNHRPGRYAAAS